MSVIIIVVGVNSLIAFAGFYLTWRLWRFKTALGKVTNALDRWEHNARHSLNPSVTPAVLLLSKDRTASLRHQYARLQLQWNQIQKFLILLRALLATVRWSQRLNQKHLKKP
jgi:hypothetical protein